MSLKTAIDKLGLTCKYVNFLSPFFLLFVMEHNQSKNPFEFFPADLSYEVDNLHSTENGEAAEEPQGATDEADLGLQGHPDVLLYLVVGGRAELDLDQMQL